MPPPSSIPMQSNRTQTVSTSSLAPSYITIKPHQSAPPNICYTHNKSRTNTPLRGTARALFALDDNVKRDLQIYVFGHCEAVKLNSKDNKRFVYQLNRGGEENGDEVVEVTEDMGRDLRECINGKEEGLPTVLIPSLPPPPPPMMTSSESTAADADGGLMSKTAPKVPSRGRNSGPSRALLMAIAENCGEDEEEEKQELGKGTGRATIAGPERKTGGPEMNDSGSNDPSDVVGVHDTPIKRKSEGHNILADTITLKDIVQEVEQDVITVDTIDPGHVRPDSSDVFDRMGTQPPYASMDDALSDMSSIRTSVFSKPTSITTKSSDASLGTADGECSRPIDAPMLESYDGCTTRTIALRRSLLTDIGRPNSTSDSSEGSVSGLHGTRQEPSTVTQAPSTFGTSHFTNSTSAVTLCLYSVPQVHADFEVEGERFSGKIGFEAPRKASRGARWMSRLKSQAKKVPRTARDQVKSTKRFAHTFVRFVPAVMTAYNVVDAL